MVLAPLFLLFLAVPIVEIYVIVQVGEAIGVLPTIALLIADSVLGTMLMRSQGRAAWRRFTEALAAGRVPTREAADGFLVVLGGALLLSPGFVTDVFGVALLLPPVRAIVRSRLIRRFTGGRPGRRPRGGGGGAGGYDVDGTAVDLDTPRLP